MSATTLQGMIDTVARLPAELVTGAAPEIERIAHAHVERTVAEQTNSYGRAWPPRGDNTGRPMLVHAAEHVTARMTGTVLVITLTGADVLHHTGQARGRVRRQIIPVGKRIPARLAIELRALFARRFSEAARAT